MPDVLEVQLIEPGRFSPCRVCELDRDQKNLTQSEAVLSEQHWIFVPTARELLTICLGCGNTLRERRLE